MNLKLFLVAAVVLPSGVSQLALTNEAPLPKPTLISNVNIFDGKTDKLHQGMQVLIKDNLIETISDEPLAVIQTDNVTMLDGGGRTLDTGPDRRPLAYLLLLRGAEHCGERRHPGNRDSRCNRGRSHIDAFFMGSDPCNADPYNARIYNVPVASLFPRNSGIRLAPNEFRLRALLIFGADSQVLNVFVPNFRRSPTLAGPQAVWLVHLLAASLLNSQPFLGSVHPSEVQANSRMKVLGRDLVYLAT